MVASKGEGIPMEMKFDYSNMIKIIDKPSAMIFPHLSGIAANNYIEQFGRICYKSEDKITDNSSEPFIKMLIRLGHDCFRVFRGTGRRAWL